MEDWRVKEIRGLIWWAVEHRVKPAIPYAALAAVMIFMFLAAFPVVGQESGGAVPQKSAEPVLGELQESQVIGGDMCMVPDVRYVQPGDTICGVVVKEPYVTAGGIPWVL